MLCLRFKTVYKPAGAQRKSDKIRPGAVAPALAEWRFEQCPVEEISRCRTYEVTRSSTLIRHIVEQKRAGVIDALTESIFLVFPIDVYWILDSPWWPLTPYLEIPAEERRRLTPSFCWQDTEADPACAAALVDPAANLEMDNGRLIPIYVPQGIRRNLVLRAIDALLVRDHADLFKLDNTAPWRNPKRGRGSTIEQYRVELKALAAWRLKRAGYG